MKRVYYHYLQWEEVSAGMWDVVCKDKKEELLKKAIEFTGNAQLYGKYMMRVVIEWPKSCEQNFTASSINHQAWVGHAACCLAIGCPEDITRQAWKYLTDDQQNAANAQADKAIQEWKIMYNSKKKQGMTGWLFQ